MYLQYGNYQHPSAEATVAIRREMVWSEGQFAKGFKDTWEIAGFLQAADAPSLTAALALLIAAYQLQGQNAGLFLDDGSSTHALLSTTSVTGVKSSGVSFPEGKGAEYSTYRSYSVTLDAEYRFPGIGVIQFTERIARTGTGGPDIIWLEPINGPPQPQMVRQQTVCRARQFGQAVGLFDWPVPPPPTWPQFELPKQRAIEYQDPKRSGPYGRPVFTEFLVTWAYEFASDLPLPGFPNVWPN
jgi:hypothetical protein